MGLQFFQQVVGGNLFEVDADGVHSTVVKRGIKESTQEGIYTLAPSFEVVASSRSQCLQASKRPQIMARLANPNTEKAGGGIDHLSCFDVEIRMFHGANLLLCLIDKNPNT